MVSVSGKNHKRLPHPPADEPIGIPVSVPDGVSVGNMNTSLPSVEPVCERFRGEASEVPDEMTVTGVETLDELVLAESMPLKAVGRGERLGVSDDPGVENSEGKVAEGGSDENLYNGTHQ